MKKILFCFILISGFCFGQETTSQEYHKMYLEKIQLYKEVFEFDEKVERHKSAIENLYPAYNQIILMDELPAVSIQKALIKDYSSKYYDLFYLDKAKKTNLLRVGLATKSEFYEYLNLLNTSLEMKTIMLINDLQVSLNNKYVNYINSNLKKLNIPRSEFDKMSEKDQDILIQSFK